MILVESKLQGISLENHSERVSEARQSGPLQEPLGANTALELGGQWKWGSSP